MKKLVAIILAMLFTFSLSSCGDGKVEDFLLEKYQDTFFYGVKDISAKKINGESYKIKIKCNDYINCEVEKGNPGEEAYWGEHPRPINSDLGKNIVKVLIYDSSSGVDEAFEEKYDSWITYELSGSDGLLNFMYCDNDAHGVTLYFGSDSLQYCEQSLRTTMGSIIINVCNEESDS